MRRSCASVRSVALDFDGWKISLHEAGYGFEPEAARPTRGSGDFRVTMGEPFPSVTGG